MREYRRPKELLSLPDQDYYQLKEEAIRNSWNCWMLAAVGSLTIREELLKNVVLANQNFSDSDYAGIFRFRFWHFGEFKEIVVDDRLPVTENGDLIFMKSRDRGECWSALLEKAYAKEINSKDNSQMICLERIGKYIKMVRLRNPWGGVEWNGAWSDGSREWDLISKEDKLDLGLVCDDDGEFWFGSMKCHFRMDWHDFSDNFSIVDVCNLHPDSGLRSSSKTWSSLEMRGHWDKLAVSSENHMTESVSNIFRKYAKHDMEIDRTELFDLLNNIFKSGRSSPVFRQHYVNEILLYFDKDSRGTIGFDEFKDLWNMLTEAKKKHYFNAQVGQGFYIRPLKAIGIRCQVIYPIRLQDGLVGFRSLSCRVIGNCKVFFTSPTDALLNVFLAIAVDNLANAQELTDAQEQEKAMKDELVIYRLISE
ncbi:calpain 11-like [Octopus sinensis]|uniref:Calpain 11-like n=1 Tax=Octopus sinensis TaxID=2607531 RepID=A0A7E6EI39_9MOLL|nr:calpain 11-like [Octopus sinensis]